MTRGDNRLLMQLYAMLDWIIIECSFLLAWWLKFKSSSAADENHLSFWTYIYWGLIYGFIAVALGAVLAAYSPAGSRQAQSRELWRLIQIHIISLPIFTSLLYVYKEVHFSRTFLLLFFICNIVLLSIGRLTTRKLVRIFLRRKNNRTRIVIVGTGPLGAEIYNHIVRLPENCTVAGFIDSGYPDEEKMGVATTITAPIIGNVDMLEDILLNQNIHEVIIALSHQNEEIIEKLIGICEQAGVRTSIVPHYLRYFPARPYLTDYAGVPVIQIRDIPLEEAANRLLKRIFDLVFSLTAIVITLPLMILIAICIRLTSEGSVIFKQERMGIDRRCFMMYKFRTMRVTSEHDANTTWTGKNDHRRTRLGAFMRRTSLDELPQFFNVLAGHMSVVGPRPERPYFVKQFKEYVPRYMIKHHVRPGMTGWAQVNGWRGDTSIEARIQCDIYYMENWTFLMDMKIIIKTIFYGLNGHNAY